MKLTEIGGAQNDGLFKAPNGIIYFRKYREGKGEIFRSCKTKSLDKARQKREEFLEQLWGEKPMKVKRQTVGELWAGKLVGHDKDGKEIREGGWYNGMKATKRPATARSIASGWFNLKPYIENMFLDEITAEWWLTTYIPKKRAEENQRAAIDNSKRKFFNEWKWLSMFLKWAHENGKTDPGYKRPKLVNPDPPVDEGKVYSDHELKGLYANSTLRMLTFLVAGEKHFMRRSEIRLLELERLDLENCIIVLRAKDVKTKQPRTFTISHELRDLFLQVIAENEAMGLKSKYVFPSLWASWKKSSGEKASQAESAEAIDRPMTMEEFRAMWESTYKKAGLAKGSRFHWLRHTGLTKATKVKGVNLVALAIFAGLSIEELQETYLHYTTDDLRGIENLVGAA